MIRRAAIVLALVSTARAGGLSRPNGISARGVGMGGAWTAWVDDATAVYFNPAAMSEIDPHVMIGGELVVGPRSYTPLADDGTLGPAQESTVVLPIPTGGIVGRFTYDDQPSRFTLGAGAWNTFGGRVRFPTTGAPALDATEDAAYEIAAGAALRVSDLLSIGAAIRIGIGLFATDATQMPFDAHLSATGAGVAMAWSALVRPVEALRIGVTWRSPLRITTSGGGTIDFGSGPMTETVEHDQVWPQQVSLGVGWAAAPRVKLAAQIDWTQWSQVDRLVVRIPANAALDQVYPEDWRDSWAVRAGGEYQFAPEFAARAGAYIDTNAVPDRTIERQYIDTDKLGVAAGAGWTHGVWRLDTGLDAVLARTRRVPNNNADTASFPADRNKAPGNYNGTLLTLELAVSRGF